MLKYYLEKTKNASPATKASIAILLSNLVLKGLSLISGPIFTRIMTTEQYGTVSVFLSWESMLSVIITLNLSSGVFNNGMLDFEDNRSQFQFSLLFISSISAIIWFGLFSIFRHHIVSYMGLDMRYIYLMFLTFIVNPAYWYWNGRQRYEFKYKLSSLITVLSAVSSLILGIILVINSPQQKAFYRVLSFEIINILLGLIFCVYIAHSASFKVRFDYCAYALKFNLPLIPHYLSMYVLSSSDRIMISRIVNKSATAIYSVASTIGSIITILWQSIEASLSPWIYQELAEGKKEDVKKNTLIIMMFFSAISIFCTLFAPEIIFILAPNSYASGIYVIPSISAGVFFTAMYSLYMRIELYYKQTNFAAIASGIAAILNVILNAIFISKIGAVAAGYTTMACYAVLAYLHYLNVKRNEIDDCLNNKAFFAISAVTIIVAMLVTLLYNHTIVRYTTIIVIIAILVIKRDLLKKLLEKFKMMKNNP